MDARFSAFCCTSDPASDMGEVAPTLGQGNGPHGSPCRAISSSTWVISPRKLSGLTGEAPSETAGRSPKTTFIISARVRTSPAVVTPGPLTGLSVLRTARSNMVRIIISPGTSRGVYRGVMVVTLSRASIRRVLSATSAAVAGRGIRARMIEHVPRPAQVVDVQAAVAQGHLAAAPA